MTERLEAALAEVSASGQRPEPGAFAAVPVAPGSLHFVGLSHDGRPCLLASSQPQQISPPAAIRMRGLEVHYACPCRILIPNASVQERVLTTVQCTASDPIEQRYFLYLARVILRIIGPAPTLGALAASIEHLVGMLQRVARPARKPLTGLIAELVVINASASAADTVMAWRSAIDETFDFAKDTLRLEVKASRTRQRFHHLSYEQCHPPHGTTGVLASLIVESSGGGTSLSEFLSQIEARLVPDHEAIVRLHEVVADTLGNTILAAMEERFDRERATGSVQFYDLTEVPAIRGNLPTCISQVRFLADLTGATTRDVDHFRASCAAAALLLPAD